MKAKDTTLTPLWIIRTLGRFDLDPCGYPGHETADKAICLPNDGLSAEWVGRVWLNPPYSNPFPWMQRLARHGNGIALVLASTDTRWFQECVFAAGAAVLFLDGRPKFLRADGSLVGLMRASALVAYGQDNASALSSSGLRGGFAGFGSAERLAA